MFPAPQAGQPALMSELMEEPDGFEHEPEDEELTAPEEETGYGEDAGEQEESLSE